MNSDKVDDFDCSESKNINKINNICKEFWVSRFDYPLVDNTYLSKDERYGVAIDSIDTKREMIRLVLVYFPATYSGLKEKSFYHQKILNHLDDWELFGETK
jgi:Na+-transporting NADH:ubiquinone oxidoreductase subunit NqrB